MIRLRKAEEYGSDGGYCCNYRSDSCGPRGVFGAARYALLLEAISITPGIFPTTEPLLGQTVLFHTVGSALGEPLTNPLFT